jgi:uncharacterized membrane protein YvbJ
MFCPNCGKQIPDGSKFCPYCGEKIEIVEEPKSFKKESLKKEKRKVRLSIILIPVVVVLIVISIVFYFEFFPQVNPAKSSEYETKGLTILSDIVANGNLADKNKLSEASRCFEKAIKLNPDSITASRNLIFTYLLSNNFSDVEKETEKMLQKNPNDAFSLKIKELLSEEMP